MARSRSRLSPGFIRDYLRPRRHSALLIAIITAFLVRPLIGDSGAAPVVFSLSLIILMLLAFYAVQVDDAVGDSRKLKLGMRRVVIGWALAGAAVIERIAAIVAPSHSLVLVGSFGWLLFFAFITFGLLRNLLRQRNITGEIICLSVSIYLLMGMTWGLFYVLLFQGDHHSFNFSSADPIASLTGNQAHLFPVFIYFSLTTLSTIGFGDITPVTLQARYAAVAEGITGQFYLAILVARLVGMHMLRVSDKDA